MSKLLIGSTAEAFHTPMSWSHFSIEQQPSLLRISSSMLEQGALATGGLEHRVVPPVTLPPEKLSTPLSATLSAAKGAGRDALNKADAAAMNRFSLAEALYYPLSSLISSGATEQLAQAPDAPEHLLRAQASYHTAKDFVAERFDAATQTLKRVAVSGLQPDKVLGILSDEMAGNFLNIASAKLDDIKNLQAPWAQLTTRWREAKTDSDWEQFGGQAVMLAAAATEIIYSGNKISRPIVLPSGAQIPTEHYRIDGRRWPLESGDQAIVYLDPKDRKTVFKQVREIVETGERPALLTTEERILIARTLPNYHNEFTSAASRAVGKYMQHARLEWAGDEWMAQPYLPFQKLGKGGLGSTETTKKNHRKMLRSAWQYADNKYAHLWNPQGNYFVDGKITFWIDGGHHNILVDHRKTLYWIDSAVVLPSRVMRTDY